MQSKEVPKFHLKRHTRYQLLQVPACTPLDLSSEDSCEGDCDIFHEIDELCSVCDLWEPKESQQCAALLQPNGPNVTIVLTGHISFTAQSQICKA